MCPEGEIGRRAPAGRSFDGNSPLPAEDPIDVFRRQIIKDVLDNALKKVPDVRDKSIRDDTARPPSERAFEQRNQGPDRLREGMDSFLSRLGEKAALQGVDPAKASKVLSSLPEVFLEKGRSLLAQMTAGIEAKPQYYVSNSFRERPTGPPGSAGNPYSSLEQALKTVPAGSVINVLAGTYREKLQIDRSDLVLRSAPGERAVIEGGSLLLSDQGKRPISNITVMNLDFKNVRGVDTTIRIEGHDISNVIIGGNSFDGLGSEAVGSYGYGSRPDGALRNIMVIGNKIANLELAHKGLEAVPFNGNVVNFKAIGNAVYNQDYIAFDAIGGEKAGAQIADLSSHINQARKGIFALNYIGGSSSNGWNADLYSDGAFDLKISHNYSQGGALCIEAGAERRDVLSENIKLLGNICEGARYKWLVVGTPNKLPGSSGDRAEVKGVIADGNVVIGNNGYFEQGERSSIEVSRNPNPFFPARTSIRALPRLILELYAESRLGQK